MSNDLNITTSGNFCGVKDDVSELVVQFCNILYPNVYGERGQNEIPMETLMEKTKSHFQSVLSNFINDSAEVHQIIKEVFNKMPEIKKILSTDVKAAYEGDPAANSYDEILLSYPSIKVMSVYRIAHELYKLKVPILPRMLTEHVHGQTGIDIHPGATIGDHFFIDHGTGVVIGETAVIGNHVKIYQGVTIGAKSFKKDQEGNIIKGLKRHPNIGNHVVIYAGATILGGDTTVGDNCVIGGNVWLTESVSPDTVVMAANNEITQKDLK